MSSAVRQRLRRYTRETFQFPGLVVRASYAVQDRFTRRLGYADMVDTVTQGVAGVGAVIPEGNGRPFAAISIAAIKPRMTPTRRAELGQSLLQMLNADATNG